MDEVNKPLPYKERSFQEKAGFFLKITVQNILWVF